MLCSIMNCSEKVRARKLCRSHYYKFMRYRKDRNKWKAEIQYYGTRYYLGMYSKKEDALIAYDKKARELGRRRIV